MAFFSKLVLRTVLTCFFLTCVLAAPVHAADGGASFVVIDIEALISESDAGKSLQDQLKKKRDAFQKEFSDREKELGEKEKSIIKQKNELSPEELNKQRQAFESDLLETRKLFQERRTALDKGLAAAMQTLRGEIVKASAEEAEEGGYKAIFLRESVVIVEKELDITKQVMDRLNKRIKTIPLNVE